MTDRNPTHMFNTVALVSDLDSVTTLFDRTLTRMYERETEPPHVLVRAAEVRVLEGSFNVAQYTNDFGVIVFNLGLAAISKIAYSREDSASASADDSFVTVTMRVNRQPVVVSFPILAVIRLHALGAIESFWRQGELIVQAASMEPLHLQDESTSYATTGVAINPGDDTFILTADYLPRSFSEEDMALSMDTIRIAFPGEETGPTDFEIYAPTMEQGEMLRRRIGPAALRAEVAGLVENTETADATKVAVFTPRAGDAPVTDPTTVTARIFDMAAYRNKK